MGEARKPNVLLGVTGSVAAIKTPQLVAALLEYANVKVVVTSAAKHFIRDADILPQAKPLLDDAGEWRMWEQKGDPVLHIDLRRWADILLIAPLSANTLAKLAQGLCDNLITSVFRAWDFSAPVVVAPAMNTLMWENNFTEVHLNAIEKLGVTIIPPTSKVLACGDAGMGAMASPENITKQCRDILVNLSLLT